MTNATIIMYHYVREISNSKFSQLKGLEFGAFKRQLDFLQRNYTVVSAENLLAFIAGVAELPERACLLTFDDGYKDHLQYVVPELLKRRLPGLFFPPAKAIMERELLNVNAIHFILASCANHIAVMDELNDLCIAHGLSQATVDSNLSNFAIANRYDSKEVVYIKRMLQHVLAEGLRSEITCVLFERYVTRDRRGFADELYLSSEDIRKMLGLGFYIGSHGYRHLWLNTLTKDNQYQEIENALAFLASVGAPTKDWIMCYPYGAYNKDTLEIIREKECAAGFTTRVGHAELSLGSFLTLSRFDTNDFAQ